MGRTAPTGTNGKDGVSPTVTQLVAGDSHCNAGGAAITDASGNTAYVCNGTDGEPFSGNFTSPNGQFSIAVTDSGVKLTSPIASVDVTATSVNLSGVTVGLSGIGDVDVSAPTIALNGSAGVEVSAPSIGLNPNGCQPAIRETDLLTAIAPPLGGPIAGFGPGSTSVCVGP